MLPSIVQASFADAHYKIKMGNRRSVFEPDLLNAYQECTYFTEKQIKKLYRRFSSLNPKKISSRTADVDTRSDNKVLQKQLHNYTHYVSLVVISLALIQLHNHLSNQ